MSLAQWTTRLLPGSEPVGGETSPAEPPAREPGAPSLIGSRVGAYLITKRLGAGGVGEVYKGVDVMLKREVAIKVLRDELAGDPLFLERFAREAQLHAKLSHPNVAGLHAFAHEGDMQFMVMEYVAGISLDEFVKSGGAVPVARALGLFRRALDGIEHAHGCGVVHRDIKPANIMLADNGQVKVMDFGIARAMDSQEHLTRHGHVAGTARAMAPEQIRGRTADVRSDIYSLGIVLYTLLAGRAPFDGETDFELMKAQLEQVPPPLPEMPRAVQAAVMRALEKDPAARFQNVGEFARAVDECLGELATALPPALPRRDESTSSRTVINPALVGAAGRPAAGRRAMRWRVGGGVVSLLALAAGAAALWRPAAPPQPVAAPMAVAPVAVAPIAVAPIVAEPTAATPIAVPPEPAVAPPRRLAIVRSSGSDAAFKPGERIELQVTPSFDAYVSCYLQDEARQIVRFYPNRFSPSALVRADTPLAVPGRMRFEMIANTRRLPETVACFASENDLLRELPPSIVGTDFAKIEATSLDEVRRAYERVGATTLTHASFTVAFQ